VYIVRYGIRNRKTFVPVIIFMVIIQIPKHLRRRSLRPINLIIVLLLISLVLETAIGYEHGLLSSSASIALDEEEPPRTIILDPHILLEIKQAAMRHGDSDILGFLEELLVEANSFLGKKPKAVTDKTQLPPSGNKHDFYSLAPYEWPNPDSPDGLPYVPRDGKINPERYDIPDKKNIDDMVNMVRILALAYYFTNAPEYASKAQELLHVWFIDKETYMNPNLKYAETVRGKNEMNSFGIMEGSLLAELVDAIRLLQHSHRWTEEMKRGMNSWFTSYLDWLLNSDSGKKEGQKANNHGTYYLVQLSSMALFINKTDLAKEILEATMQEPDSASVDDESKLIAEKIKPDGHQPFEAERANALDYHMFNLLGLFRLASIGERVGLDLWNYEYKGAGLRKALDYILPYALNEQEWPYKQIIPIKKMPSYGTNVAKLSCQGMIYYENNELYVEAYKSVYTGKQGIDIYYPICNKIVS
jgi:hypothetical protein